MEEISLLSLPSQKNCRIVYNEQDIQAGDHYIIHLIDKDAYLFVKCTFRAIRAADMRVFNYIEDGHLEDKYNHNTISFVYEHMHQIHLESYDYYHKCRLYKFTI